MTRYVVRDAATIPDHWYAIKLAGMKWQKVNNWRKLRGGSA